MRMHRKSRRRGSVKWPFSTDAPSFAGGWRTIFLAKEHGVSNNAPRLRM
jgi:hypothetical protein